MHRQGSGNAPASGQIVGLDIVRFLAALIVAFYHLFFCAWAHPEGLAAHAGIDLSALQSARLLTRDGWVGVQAFFVLSGLVIAYSAEQESAGRFARRRFLRLMPGIWICSTLLLLLAPLGTGSIRAELVPYANSMLLMPFGPWMDGVYWTLGVEISFYVMVFALLACGRLRHLPVAIGAIGLLSTGLLLADMAGHPIGLPFVAGATERRLMTLMMLEHGMFFALGVTIYRANAQGGGTGTTLQVATWLFACLLSVKHEAVATARFYHDGASATTPALIFALAVIAMIAAIRFNAALKAQFPRIAGSARRLGLMTYPLYLLHAGVGSVVIVQMVSRGASAWPAAILGLAAAIAAAALVSTYAEPALRRAIDRLFAAWRSHMPAHPLSGIGHG